MHGINFFSFPFLFLSVNKLLPMHSTIILSSCLQLEFAVFSFSFAAADGFAHS